MAEASFKRKALFFVVAVGILSLLLIVLPFVEDIFFQYFLNQLGLTAIADGKLVLSDGRVPSMMTQTIYDLLVNIFHVVNIIIWMTLTVIIVRFVGDLIFSTAIRHSGQTEIASLSRTVLSIIIYIVAFFIIFQSQYPHVQLTALFTGSTILGIVVGLALQDTLGNLFAGIAMQADQPFQVGDVVSITSRGSGVVEAVSWRGVKIRTFQNKLLVISNSVLGREVIEVAPKDNLNARLVFFSTDYLDSPSKTIQTVRDTVRHVENVSNKKRPIVRIKNLGEGGIDWEIKYWPEEYTRYNDTDALIRQRIWYLFKRENIAFSQPTQTIHIEPRPVPQTVEEAAHENSDQLSVIPIFSPLSEEEIDRLARSAVKRIFAPGEMIVRKGQEGRSMFIILRGNVNVQIPEGEQQKVINRLTINDFFGEMSLLTGEPRTATVVADDEVEVLEIRKRALKPIFEANPDLMSSVCEIIEERKQLLLPSAPTDTGNAQKQRETILTSIRRFFGIKNKIH